MATLQKFLFPTDGLKEYFLQSVPLDVHGVKLVDHGLTDRSGYDGYVVLEGLAQALTEDANYILNGLYVCGAIFEDGKAVEGVLTNGGIAFILPTQRVADVLCNALEGGSNHWYWMEKKIAPRTWTFDSDPARAKSYHWLHDYPLNDGGALLMCDINERHETGHETYRLDAIAIKNGMRLMAHDYPDNFKNILEENDDAVDADILLQLSLFGTIVY